MKDLGNGWRRQANDKMVERKWMWHESLKGKYKEVLDKYEKHVAEYGQPENHPYGKKRGDPGCPLIGNQCPIKANAAMDYSGDYGFPESGIYSKSEVQKSSLLTVEEFQARQREDDDAHNEGVGDSDGSGAAGLHPPGKGALGGMLKQIFAAGP
uniref:Uncharacterized protein n=1 Tax=Craspedostauros australis TaxID=1486917 RepID=A0A7R9ZKQ1_9STRA